MNKIKVYFVSDGTGLSTEQLGKSILIQARELGLLLKNYRKLSKPKMH